MEFLARYGKFSNSKMSLSILCSGFLNEEPTLTRCSSRRNMGLSPLSAAIITNSSAIFKLLVDHGVDIHGTEIESTTWLGNHIHIPVLAAVSTMAKYTHGIEMMQLCLGSGAKADYSSDRPPSSDHFYFRIYPATPLSCYLDSIEDWGGKAPLSPIVG